MTALELSHPSSVPALPGLDGLRQRLIAREKALIQENERLRDLSKHSSYGQGWIPYQVAETLKNARKRLAALQAGLLPVRISGSFIPINAFLRAAHSLPSQIIMKAEEASARLPGLETRVYGLSEETEREMRRRADPVLIGRYGASDFFLGFWLEVQVPDREIPEFFGITVPLLPKRGRGRPRKNLMVPK